MFGPLTTLWPFLSRTGRLFWLTLVIIVFATLASYHPWKNRGLSHEPGLRGEIVRGADGKDLYFDGACRTERHVARA